MLHGTVPARRPPCRRRRRDRTRCPAGELGHRPEALHRRQLVRVLLEAIDHLPPTYAEVVRMRDLDERPVAEVAQELHLSRSNVAVRLHRAHKLLRRRFLRALGPPRKIL